ncbi:MAG TPA: type IV secretion system DNA-binding domain-containing protein, partial [Steroidobacteraceae bacterium]|nr:type IV secretion system DNA-binding domain-containing protein [Steroidobacteraceae bacterium]
MAMLDGFTHGWPQFVAAWLLVVLGISAALRRRRAPAAQYLVAPLLAVPGLLLGMVGTALAKMVLVAIGVGGVLRAACLVAVYPLTGFAGGLWMLRRRRVPGDVLRRGAVVLSGDMAGARGARRGGAQTLSELTLAGLPVAPEDEAKHFKLIGTTGTGKSTAIRELLSGALARGDRAVIADPDGGYLTRFYDASRGDVILNPFEARAHAWDLFAEIRERHDVEQLAGALIPDEAGTDNSWREYARTFFTAVARRNHEDGMHRLPEVYRLLATAEPEELRQVVHGSPAQPFLAGGNERMFGSVRSVTGSALRAFDYLARQEGPPIGVRDWVREGQGVLFLPYRADQVAALRSIIAAWTWLAIFECMSQGEGDRRLWFVVDELDALGAIDGLKDALARLRKFGGRCVLGFQSIGQVSDTYGRGEAQTIVENCGNTLILRCSASEDGGTASFASRLIGQREVIRPTVSRNRPVNVFDWGRTTMSHGQQHVLEPAVL